MIASWRSLPRIFCRHSLYCSCQHVVVVEVAAMRVQRPVPEPAAQARNDAASVAEDSNVAINVLANDVDVNAGTLNVGSAPTHGDVTLIGELFEYTPHENFNGMDSFTYTVNSSAGDQLTATVSISVADVNDEPIATPDMVQLIENTPTTVTVASNDDDVDGDITSLNITVAPGSGTAETSGAELIYTPDAGFTGSDQLTYQAIDDDGASSNEVILSIRVEKITETKLTITRLNIPQTGYASENNQEFGQTLFTSAVQSLTVPANAVSFALTLSGLSAGEDAGSLFITDLQSPEDDVPTFRKVIGFCSTGICSSLLPRRPGIVPGIGQWSFTLGTIDATLDDVDLQKLSLNLAVRTGPGPLASEIAQTNLTVHPFLTATGITELELQSVLDRFVVIAADNNINVVLQPTTIITDPRFSEVSKDFNAPTTSELVSMGGALTVNLFFLDSFAGESGASTVGISGGLPGTQGIKGGFNGVLINALAVQGGTVEFYVRNTAQFAFHEMGHFLGLYHTSEGDFSGHDVIDDTSECDATLHDTNGNGIAELSECPDNANPMFWNPDLSNAQALLSDDQRTVLFHAPVARPD